MTTQLRDTFSQKLSEFKVDSKLVRRLVLFEREFVTRNEAHVEFFGGTLLGYHKVVFTDLDRERWFDEILQEDESEVIRIIAGIDSVEQSFARTSDPYNLSALWVVHRLMADKKLSRKEKEQGAIAALLLLHYKMLTSFVNHVFKYPTSKDLAIATYAALSKKFSLKQYGSWSALLKARCEDIISPKSIHRKTVETYTDDDAVFYQITDIQTRIKAIVKNITDVFYQLRDSDRRIVTTANSFEHDGEFGIKDRKSSFGAMKRVLHEAAGMPQSFVREDYMDVICSAMHTMPPKALKDTLLYMSKHYKAEKGNHGWLLIEALVEHAVDQILTDKDMNLKQKDLAYILVRMRAIYMASKNKEADLMAIKNIAEELARKGSKLSNPSTLASVRTGLMLYVLLFGLVGNRQ